MVEMYADITKQEHLVDDIFSMILRCPAISEVAHSGQFVSVYSKDSARLLPRPISICEVDKKAGTIRLVYRTVGAGTTEYWKWIRAKQFSSYSHGWRNRNPTYA